MYKYFFKRLFDIILSLLALIILSPLLIVLYFLVKSKLGSPVFFRQERPGKDEKTFELIKFRSMNNRRDEHGELLPDQMRLAKFGKVLRSTSLDELPELWCILKGDMSFVGPRPLSVLYLPFYTEKEAQRHSVRPGLTGLAQVRGRNSLNWDQRLQYDIEYVSDMSLSKDIKILWETIMKVIKREGVIVSGTGKVQDLDEIRSVHRPEYLPEKDRENAKLINKKLLLLGGSRNMKEILDAAHSMGVKVGITDWYPVEKSPTKELADEYFNVSINGDQEIDKIIKENGYDGVMTGYTDSYLETYAKICARNNLYCYGDLNQFEILTNKEKYKSLFDEYGVPTLPRIDINELDETTTHFPMIFKPTDGSGGKGIEIIRSYEEFQDFEKTLTNKSDYIIEPYVSDRQELTAFFLFIDGEVTVTGTANRYLSSPQGDKIGLPMVYRMPSTYDDVFNEFTGPPMVKLFQDLGLKDGMLFAQCLIYDGIPNVYDVGYRLTGTLEYKLFDQMYGFNPLKMMIRHSLTGNMLAENETKDIKSLLDKSKLGFNITILGKKGTMGSIMGEEELTQIPGIFDVAYKMRPGDAITEKDIGTLNQIMVRIFMESPNISEASQTLEQIYDTLKIVDTNGNDMILERYVLNGNKSE